MLVQELLGKMGARMSWLNDSGYEDGDDLHDYEGDFVLVDDDLEITFQDSQSNDWIELPPRGLALSEATLVEAWNASLPATASADNRAPNSPRFKRFMDRVKNAQPARS